MKTTQEFKQILSEVKNIDIPSESAVQVATVILQESGKDRRGEAANAARMNGNGNGFNRNYSKSNQPATDKQKDALKKWHVEFSDDITKAEASALLDYAIEHANSNAKGRTSPASSALK